MKYTLFVLAFFLVLAGCKNQPGLLNQYANTNALPMQQFIINTAADTTLTGVEGIKVFIAKGTFTGVSSVTVLLKEALDYASILKAGLLTTTTDGKALSSGGMFYLSTKENAAINKPIQVSVPTKFADPAMQLYKGKEGEEGITWEEPKTIDSSIANNAQGKAIFDKNCASCHRIDRDLTGPALAGISSRKTREWLYEFTANPAAFISHEYYSCNLKKQYGSMMTAFPSLRLDGLNAVYNYIDAESKKLGYSVTYEGKNSALDSCDYYRDLLVGLKEKRNELREENGGAVEIRRTVPAIMPPASGEPDTAPPPTMVDNIKKIEALDYKADYYKVEIETSGWYNIDVLLKEDKSFKPSSLMVRLQGSYTERIQVYLAIPSSKILQKGGFLDDRQYMGFYESNGNIRLPQDAKALIYAIGENKGEFYFSKAWFTTQPSQTITITPVKMDKQGFEKELAGLGFEDIKSSVTESKNINSLKGIDSVLEKLKGMGLEGCDCVERWTYKEHTVK